MGTSTTFFTSSVETNRLSTGNLQTSPCLRTKKCVYNKTQLFCADICQIGSVQVDPLLSYALKTQRELQLDTPLNYWTVPGTHNSGISRAYGHGLIEDGLTEMLQDAFKSPNLRVYIANQVFSINISLFYIGLMHLLQICPLHWN